MGFRVRLLGRRELIQVTCHIVKFDLDMGQNPATLGSLK